MWVTGKAEWDFVSYEPRMPASHRLLVITVYRDETFIDNLQETVLEAEIKVQALLKDILSKAA